MGKHLPTRVSHHEKLTREQQTFLGELELPAHLYQVWNEFLAGLLGSLVEGYHAGTQAPDWQGCAKTLYLQATREHFTPQEKQKGTDYLTLCLARYKPVQVLDLLMRCDVVSREREKAAAEAREKAKRSQLPLGNAA